MVAERFNEPSNEWLKPKTSYPVHPDPVNRFVRVEEHTADSVSHSSDQIIRALNGSGRRGVLEAIASTVESDPMSSETRHTIASWLRVIAAKDL